MSRGARRKRPPRRAPDARTTIPEPSASIDVPRARAEPWAPIAYALLLILGALFAYLALRPGGRGPLWVWRSGRDLCFLAALLTLLCMIAWSSFHRPFLRRSRVIALLALVLVIGVTPFQLPFPSSHEDRPSAVPFRLPVEGEWRVLWGGSEKQSNRLAGFFAEQRWALALVREQDGRRTREDALPGVARRPADFLAFGEPVVAPAAGTVVWTRDGLPDGDLVTYARDIPPLGNTIVLEVGAHEFVFLCHLEQGSIQIGAGEQVESGTILARVGSSGLSRLAPEPHLLTFLQDSAEEGAGEPIPWSFHALLVDDRYIEEKLPRGGIGIDGRLSGERVCQAPLPAAEAR